MDILTDSTLSSLSELGVIAAAALARWDGRGGESLPPAEALAAAGFALLLRPKPLDARKHCNLLHTLRAQYVPFSRARRCLVVF